MSASQDVVIVGRFGAAHGIRGDIRVRSFTDPADNITRYSPWLVAVGESWQPVEVARVRSHGDGFVAHVAGCEDRNSVEERLRGKDIAVPAASLPAAQDDEYYWRELLGMSVVTPDGTRLGKVAWLLQTGPHDVLVVHEVVAGQTAPRERLIPFVARYVPEVDRESGRIVADWDPDL